MLDNLDRQAIFVGGIHGVGKTTLCKELAKDLKINYYSASKIISSTRDEDTLWHGKKVKNINKNQDLLLENLSKYVKDKQPYILDGHFCLMDDSGEINDINIEVFKALNLKTIIVLIDDISEIVSRLKKRDSKDYSAKMIKTFQEKEVESALNIASNLGIQCEIIHDKVHYQMILDYFKGII